jgi:hypothetical protein
MWNILKKIGRWVASSLDRAWVPLCNAFGRTVGALLAVLLIGILLVKNPFEVVSWLKIV